MPYIYLKGVTMMRVLVKTRWVVAKAATIRKEPDKESAVIQKLDFGKTVNIVNDTVVNGRVKVSYRPYVSKRFKQTVVGWIPAAAISADAIEDFARLYYTNRMSQSVPTYNLINGNIIGGIKPGEMVEMVAKVGEWCLTNKGWSMFRFFRWKREIYDGNAAGLVYVGIIEWSIKDYKLIIRRLKKHQYKTPKEFCLLVDDMDRLMKWFQSNRYSNMLDPVSGEERLMDLNRDCGIDDAWIKEKRYIRDSIERKHGRYRRK